MFEFLCGSILLLAREGPSVQPCYHLAQRTTKHAKKRHKRSVRLHLSCSNNSYTRTRLAFALRVVHTQSAPPMMAVQDHEDIYV